MYKSVEQTAIELNMPEEQVLQYIYNGRIRAVFDGEHYLVNGAQFDTYHQQIERIKEEIEIWKNTPIPEDIDVKDEDQHKNYSSDVIKQLASVDQYNQKIAIQLTM